MYGVQQGFIPELGGWMPLHNEDMRTSVHDVYVAGDIAGVEEANTAMDEAVWLALLSRRAWDASMRRKLSAGKVRSGSG